MAISATGLGSGLDIKSLVDQLVAAERTPVATRLATQEARANAELTGIGRLKGALSGFKSAVDSLADINQLQRRKVTVSDTEKIRARVTADAEPGSYQVEVVSLASAHRLVSGAFASASAVVGEGTFVIGSGANSRQIEITSANNTVAGIRDAINAAGNDLGIRASIVTGADGAHLILSAAASGAANAITVDAVTAGSPLEAIEFGTGTTNSLTEATAAADAVARIDGQRVTSASNAISGAVDGLTIDLLKAEPGTPVTVDISNDADSVKGSITKFINAYNTVITTINELTAYNADTRSGGVLIGDSATRTIKAALRETLSRNVGDASASFRSLAEIGITTASDGKLSLNGTRLDKAIADDFNAVGQVFADSTDGIAVQLKSTLGDFLAINGRIGARESTLKARLETISDRRSDLELRMEQVRKRYQKQFTALDSLVSQLNQTSNYLTKQLANLK